MFKKTLVSAAAIALVLLCPQGGATNPHRADHRTDHLADSRLDEVALRSLAAYGTAEVRSLDDLADHLRRAGDHSPLAALDPAARSRFIESLAFNERGLTHYRYDLLRDNLTASQGYRILRLFGAEGSGSFLRASRVETEIDEVIAGIRMFDDHVGAKCVSPHNCQTGWVDFICMSGC